jgi:hypothetical protein
MTWYVRHDTSLGIIEVTYAGLVDGSDLWEACSRRIVLEQQTGSHAVLVDASEIDLVATVLDVFSLPAKLYEEKRADRKTRIALVLPRSEKAIEFAKFYETACTNRGWSVKVFQDRQGAIEWLTHVAAPDPSGPGGD